MSEEGKPVPWTDPDNFPPKEMVEKWVQMFELGMVSIGELQISIRGRVLPGSEDFKDEFFPKNIGEILKYLPIQRNRNFDDVFGPKDSEGNEYSWAAVFKMARRLKKRRWRVYYWCRYHAISVNVPAIIIAALIGASLARLVDD